jgi:hypothetical protein
MKKLLVLALVLMAANAFAQVSTGPSGLGIYFETGALTNSKTYAGGATVTAYIVATHITTAAMGTYEFEVVLDGDVVWDDVTWTYANASTMVNALNPPLFIVGIAPATPAETAMYLVRIRFPMPDAETPVKLGLGPATPPSIPGRPCYANGDYTALFPFTLVSDKDPVAGRPGFYYLAGVNTAGPVATAHDSWSGVKSLYR